MRTRLLYTFGVGSLWAAVACAQQTPCPLGTAKNGDTVTLQGEVFPTAHDTFIRPAGCDERVILVYGDDPSLGKSKIPIKRDEAFQQYETYLSAEQKPSGITDCKECWKYRVTAEFQGRLDITGSAGWKKDPKSGKVTGIEGFGHPLPFTRYRLVIASVSKVQAVERAQVLLPEHDEQGDAVALCRVAEKIQTYSGREVRIKAFFAVGRESVVLYDPKCQDGKPMVWVEFKPKVAGQMKALRRIVESKRSALVTVEGTMHGGEPVKVDPNLPDWLKDRFRGSSQTYGHLGSFDMMIEVQKVIDAKAAGDGINPKVAAEDLHHDMQHAEVAGLAEKRL